MFNLDELPEKERVLIAEASNGGIAADRAICEAIIRNTLAVNDLKKTIVQLNKNSDKLNRRILWLSVFTVLLSIIQAEPIISGWFHWLFGCSK